MFNFTLAVGILYNITLSFTKVGITFQKLQTIANKKPKKTPSP